MLWLFNIITFFEIIEILYATKKTRQILSVHNVFFVSVVINFILYLQRWSTYFIQDCSYLTFSIIIVSQILVTSFDIINIKKEVHNQKYAITDYGFRVKKFLIGDFSFCASSAILLLCLLCSMAENYTSYGTLLPFLNDIDAHKNTVPIFGTIWRSLYPVGLIFFFLELRIYKKHILSYLFLLSIIMYMLLSGGSRFWSVLSIGSAIIFYFVYCKPKIKIKTIMLFSFLAFLFIIVLLKMGYSRLTVMTFEEKIGYIGPFANTSLGEVAAWYYGYFPYSFYNLNLTLSNIQENSLYTYGLFFLLPVLLVTKSYKIMDISSYDQIAMSVRVITNSSATVATAFFEFYADFGPLFFLSIIFYLWLLYSLRNSKSVFGAAGYSYLLLCWSLFNFYNVISNGIPYTMLLVLFVCCKLFIYKDKRININNARFTRYIKERI